MQSRNYLSAIESDWVEQNVRPDVYAVGTVKQGIWIDETAWIKGNAERYDQAVSKTLDSLNRRIFKNAHKRFGKVIPIATTLEGDGGDTVRYHLNFLIQKPRWLSFEEFRDHFKVEWVKNPWAMPQLWIEERTGNCVRYSLKEGPEALLPLSTRF